MVEVNLKNIGRRFAIHWIFRKIDLQLKTNEHTVILGKNGSGKSTLLKIISGILSPSEGEVHYLVNNNKVDVDSIYKSLSLCTPYLSIPEEFTLDELLSFHQKLKPLNQKQISRANVWVYLGGKAVLVDNEIIPNNITNQAKLPFYSKENFWLEAIKKQKKFNFEKSYFKEMFFEQLKHNRINIINYKFLEKDFKTKIVF